MLRDASTLSPQAGPSFEAEVHIETGEALLEGTLVTSHQTKAVVIFAHGSGSSRLSPRNRYVAKTLQEAGIGTLLFDLLTREEDESYENRFDISLLARRLTDATNWLLARRELRAARIGYLGASTGAAAALQASVGRGGGRGRLPRREARSGSRPSQAGPRPPC